MPSKRPFNYSRPRSDWAVEKVRVFVPQIHEKGLLMAIAGHARHDGTCVWAGIDTLAYESGLSRATVHRQLKKLVEKKLLIIEKGGHGARDTNVYSIPCCALALKELEVLTGVSGRQLVLPIAGVPEKSEVTVSELWQPVAVGVARDESNYWVQQLGSQSDTLKGVIVRQEGSQSDTQTKRQITTEPGLGLILKKKGRGSVGKYTTGRDEDRKAFDEGHSTQGLEVLKELNPGLYAEIQRTAGNTGLPDPVRVRVGIPTLLQVREAQPLEGEDGLGD